MSFVAVAVAGGAVGLAGTVGKMIGRGKANKAMDNLLTQDPSYKANPLAAQRLGLAQTLLNSRMPGAASMERNIYQNQANQMGQVNRNATDSSQALALASASQGQSNQAFNQLGLEENQDYQRRYSNLSAAQDAQINEQDKVYQDNVRRFGDLAQVRATQNANRQASWSDITNMGFGAMGLGVQGLMGGYGGTPNVPTYTTPPVLSPMQGQLQSPNFNFSGIGGGVGMSNFSGIPYMNAQNQTPTYGQYMQNQLGH